MLIHYLTILLSICYLPFKAVEKHLSLNPNLTAGQCLNLKQEGAIGNFRVSLSRTSTLYQFLPNPVDVVGRSLR